MKIWVGITASLLLLFNACAITTSTVFGSVEIIPRAHFLDFIDYTFTLNSTQIFPNETLKNDILSNHTRSQYNISSLDHELMGHDINATDVRVNVTPSTIDDTRTRLDLEIYAERVNVTGSTDRFYDSVQLESIYGIHDRRSDTIEMHIPINVALSYLGSLS